MQVLCIHVGDVVEIDLSDGDKEHFAVMEVTELFEDTQVCEQSAHYTQSTLWYDSTLYTQSTLMYSSTLYTKHTVMYSSILYTKNTIVKQNLCMPHTLW